MTTRRDEHACWTKVEVSEILGLSLQAVDELLASGALQSRRAGRTVLVAHHELERFQSLRSG